MLFGEAKQQNPQTSQDSIFDVTTDTFEAQVIQASMDRPILVDFWAPWCGPCKQLGPVLESAVSAAGGKVAMAKVNIDENPELAQALRVQSIPTVYAFFQGKPVTAFNGARPASEVKMLIDQLSKMAAQSKPEAINIPETLSLAAQSLGAGEIESAQGLYAQVLGQDENNAAAYAGLIRSFIAVNDLEQAQFMVDDAPDEIKKHPEFAAAKTAIEMEGIAKDSGDAAPLAAAIAKNPDDYQARFDYALSLFSNNQRAEAIDQLIEIMSRDKAAEKKWGDDKARLQLLKFFDAMGASDPETAAGRRKLSSLLFS